MLLVSSRLRILLVEDNRVNQLVARGLLERQGHSVTLAENGRQAVDLFLREDFDLVFMDVQMPEMDGLEATVAIRAAEAQGDRPRTPIIALTAQALPEDREACLEAGMDFYLSKPVDRQALDEAVFLAASGRSLPRV
jgi:two-component system CheB/CheR fusion protein